MKKNINLIGISGKGGKALAGELAKREYNVKSFASPVKAIVSLATGISVERLSDPDVLDSYLPMEWDYVIEQRVMNGSGNITRVPVRFRTKVRDMIMKVFTDMGRTAHSNFWVNTFLNTWKKGCL
jgi:putative NADH-flavin reductase